MRVDGSHGVVDIDEFGIKAQVQLGDRSAAVLCEALKVASQNDKEKVSVLNRTTIIILHHFL